MRDKILLNDLLQLSQEDIERTKVKLNSFNGSDDPIDEYKRDPDALIKWWVLWRDPDKRPYFREGNLALGLVRISGDKWLFICVLEIDKLLSVPETGGTGYEAHEIDRLKKYSGRVIVKYHRNGRFIKRNYENVMNDLEVIEVLSDEYRDDHFPGYDNVRLPYAELKRIIDRDLPEWKAALSNQKGVYLITDTNTGKMYVGSATSSNGMLLQRWSDYVSNGHGGNKELRELVKREGFDYVKKYFVYSLLENYNGKVDDSLILKRESWWKETLLTRKFGYNRN